MKKKNTPDAVLQTTATLFTNNRLQVQASLNDFLLNKACSMDQNKHRRFYTIKFKLQVVDYAKEHGNRAAERRFGSPPTEKMIRAWQ